MSGYRKARFHIDSGPDTLFRRVHQKLDGHYLLPEPGHNMRKRMAERGVPLGVVRDFDSEHWELMTAEVRVDRGKFVATGWRIPCDGSWLWVVIGMNQRIEKAMFKQGRGKSEHIVCDGELFEFVDEVNLELTEEESWRDDWDAPEEPWPVR